jgi:hypothetical protein
MKSAAFALLNPQCGHAVQTERHDVREWLRCHEFVICDDRIPRAPPGMQGGGKERLKAWSDGLPAADREA